MKRLVALLAMAACGGGSGATGTTSSTKRGAGGGAGVTATTLRDRIKKLCGAGYQAQLDGAFEGCDWIKLDAWRGRAAFEATGEDIRTIDINVVGPVKDVEAMRKRALEPVADLFDAGERAQVEKALARLFQKSAGSIVEAGGWLSDLYVSASTSIEVEHPNERWVELRIERGREGDRVPFVMNADADQFQSPAKDVSAKWIADANALCTELVTLVSKTNKLEVAPPLWSEGDVFVDCKHPNENIVAQFVATWAPGTKRLLYLRFVADMPQKKFSGYVDKLLGPLVSPAQLAVARTAAKKAPLDRKYEANGLQFGSRHDTGGFFGESHEIEMTVQIGYQAGAGE